MGYLVGSQYTPWVFSPMVIGGFRVLGSTEAPLELKATCVQARVVRTRANLQRLLARIGVQSRGFCYERPSVAYSRSVITELMVRATNFGGKVHGGTLMSLMDKLATAQQARGQLLRHGISR